jgi:actin-related protein
MQTMQEKDQALLEECIRHISLAQSPQTMREILQKERKTTSNYRISGMLTFFPKGFVFDKNS